MESLLFPIMMLAVTGIGGSILIFVMKKSRKGTQLATDGVALQTAQQFINVKDIRGRYLYTRDEMIFVYLRIQPVSIDLYSRAEKNAMIRSLTAELSGIQYPFKFLALSRPVDIAPLVEELGEMLGGAEDRRREILRQEILQMGGFALSGEIVERQFYLTLWEKQEDGAAMDGAERELSKRASLLMEKLPQLGEEAKRKLLSTQQCGLNHMLQTPFS